MDTCVFCKIVAGEIPNHTVYEDAHTLAFLDIFPAVEGYVLVIPKKHSDYLWNMDDEDYQQLMSVVKKVGSKIRDVYPEAKAGLHIEGLDVAHTHAKVFPFRSAEEFRATADHSVEPDHEALALVAEKLKITT